MLFQIALCFWPIISLTSTAFTVRFYQLCRWLEASWTEAMPEAEEAQALELAYRAKIVSQRNQAAFTIIGCWLSSVLAMSCLSHSHPLSWWMWIGPLVAISSMATMLFRAATYNARATVRLYRRLY